MIKYLLTKVHDCQISSMVTLVEMKVWRRGVRRVGRMQPPPVGPPSSRGRLTSLQPRVSGYPSSVHWGSFLPGLHIPRCRGSSFPHGYTLVLNSLDPLLGLDFWRSSLNCQLIFPLWSNMYPFKNGVSLSLDISVHFHKMNSLVSSFHSIRKLKTALVNQILHVTLFHHHSPSFVIFHDINEKPSKLISRFFVKVRE